MGWSLSLRPKTTQTTPTANPESMLQSAPCLVARFQYSPPATAKAMGPVPQARRMTKMLDRVARLIWKMGIKVSAEKRKVRERETRRTFLSSAFLLMSST